MKKIILFAAIVIFSVAVAAQSTDTSSKPLPQNSDVKKTATDTGGTMTTLDGGIGPCSAEFHVRGADGKPIYNALVHTLIKYGAFGIRKTELEVATSADGKAKLTGLPDVNKRPIFFDIKQGTKVSQRAFEPGTNCHPVYEVILQ
jgi:hypothetical protein